MKKSFIVLLIISLMACTNKKRNELPLFNEFTFKMYAGESIVEINSKTKNKYFKYFNNRLIQVPLFKYIKHNNYEIFIGIPYNTSIEAIVKNQLEKQDSSITNLKYDSLSYYEKYKRDDFYITEYARKISNKSLLYISTMSKSRELTDSLFSELGLSNRINTNNK